VESVVLYTQITRKEAIEKITGEGEEKNPILSGGPLFLFRTRFYQFSLSRGYE
jgi:hypothetical protein